MTLHSISFKQKTANNGNYCSVETFKLGRYIVKANSHKYKDGFSYKGYSVSNEGIDFLPEIYYEDSDLGRKDKGFYIRTTAYGLLSAEDIDKVIAGYKEAQEAVKILTMNFC